MGEKKNVESFLAGFFLGGLIGAGLALLFAPASGEETRAQISQKAQKLWERGKEGADYVRKVVRDEISTVKENVGDIKTAVEKGVEEYKKQKA